MIAILYVRYSTPGQRDGDSDRRQRAAADAYARTHGLALEVKVDDGLSSFDGANITRGQLGLFVRDLESGVLPAGTILLVEDLSRFSRQATWQAMAVLARIMEKGGILIDISDGNRYERSSMDLLKTLSFVVRQGAAHEESSMKSRRISSSWKHKQSEAKDGVPLTRMVPHGITVVGAVTNARKRTEGCSYAIVEEEANAVRYVFSLAADGYSEHAIAREMNKSSFPPPRGKSWGKSTIARFLREDRYIG